MQKLLKNKRFRFYREYLQFRRNVEISLKFAIKLQSFSLINDIKNEIISSHNSQTHFAFIAKKKTDSAYMQFDTFYLLVYNAQFVTISMCRLGVGKTIKNVINTRKCSVIWSPVKN